MIADDPNRTAAVTWNGTAIRAVTALRGPDGLGGDPLANDVMVANDREPNQDACIGIGVALGIVMGAALGTVLGNVAIGIALGPTVGVALARILWSSRRGKEAD